MRILLSHHAPIQQSPAGSLPRHLALALQGVGDEVRLLVADREHRFGEQLAVDRVVCGDDPNADLKFALPRFRDEDATTGRPTFAELSDAQLARYRDCLRRRLDNLIMRFDPHVIHVQHIWILGQLALESGVPYVLNAWPSELEYADDERYQPLVEQAAENASRILVADDAMKQRVEALFETTADRVVVMPPQASDSSDEAAAQIATGQWLHAVYQELLTERFG